MDEIYTFSRSSDHMDEIKSTRLLRYFHIIGENVRAFKSESNMGKSSNIQCNSHRELFRVDGKTIAFEWNIFTGPTSLEILQKFPKDLQEQNIEPENCEARIIFMSMFHDIGGTRRGNSEQCISNSEQVTNYGKKFTKEHWDIPRTWKRKEVVWKIKLLS